MTLGCSGLQQILGRFVDGIPDLESNAQLVKVMMVMMVMVMMVVVVVVVVMVVALVMFVLTV